MTYGKVTYREAGESMPAWFSPLPGIAAALLGTLTAGFMATLLPGASPVVLALALGILVGISGLIPAHGLWLLRRSERVLLIASGLALVGYILAPASAASAWWIVLAMALFSSGAGRCHR